MTEQEAPSITLETPKPASFNPNLEMLRSYEFDLVLSRIPPGSRLLDLGGGNGLQAKLFAEKGFQVRSVDVELHDVAYFPVELYDGVHLPLESGSVDVVFSSNVLEHVQQLPALLDEIRRVLAPGGIAIHLMPSSVWRGWTTMMRYPFMVKVALGLRKMGKGASTSSDLPKSRRILATAKKALFERPHGEFPGAIHELYYFGGARWRGFFEKHGYEIVEQTGNGIFYTGYSTFPALNISARRRLAKVLGSSCHVFVVRPRD